jgi:hypothetical protein
MPSQGKFERESKTMAKKTKRSKKSAKAEAKPLAK